MSTSPTFHDALCAVDGSEDSLAAVAQAAALVGPHGQLTVLIATAFRHQAELRSPRISPVAAGEIIERAREAARGAGPDPTFEVDPSASPVQLVLARSAEHDLLAIGAPGETTLFGSLLMDSVSTAAQELLQTALLVARPQPDGAARHVLVASDGLEDSEGLVELGAELARGQGASATLVHVLGAEQRLHPHRIERQAGQLESLLRERTGKPRIELGVAREVIVAVARDLRASLILMSSRRLGGLRSLGSVSRPVVAHAPCSVLLIAPERLACVQAG